MNGKFYLLVGLLLLSACGGGSDSSGGFTAETISDCAIDTSTNTLALDDGSRCNFTAAQVASFPGFAVGIAECSIADQEFIVSGITFDTTANETIRFGLTLQCTVP